MPSIITPNPTGYIAYRLNISANNGQSSTEAREVRLRETPGGANIAPIYFASAFAPLSSSEANAFDDSDATIWNMGLPSGALEIFLTQGRLVVEYTVVGTGAQGGNRNPMDWTFEGSRGGGTWEVLDTVAGQTGWSDFEERVFTIT